LPRNTLGVTTIDRAGRWMTDRLAAHKREQAGELFRLGRTSIRTGDVAHGRELLLRAVDYDREHSDAWLWLSATTDDPAEQLKYLEWAVAADPANVQARRGVAVLTGRIATDQLLPVGAGVAPRLPTGPEATEVRRTFDCASCGGRLRFDPETVDLKCASCGAIEVVEEVPLGDVAQPLDFTLPTIVGHRWSEAERAFVCEQCGAATVLPVGGTSTVCPFCDNPALVQAAEERELVPPAGLVPMALEEEGAYRALKAWLGRGWWAPDDLGHIVKDKRLRPAYVPFWVFEATLTVRWRAEIAEGTGRYRRWSAQSGERTQFFTDQLQAGLRSLPEGLLRHLPTFDLSRLIVFKPEYLADWPAALYDLSLADASLRAHEAMVKAAEAESRGRIAAGREVRDLEVFPDRFTGELFKLVYLPLWIGAYHYRGRAYQVLVNGQTGAVGGERPRDPVKIGLALILAGTILTTIALALMPLLAR